MAEDRSTAGEGTVGGAGDGERAPPKDAARSLVAAVRRECGAALRDVHVIDERDHEALYLREDVRERLADVAVDRYIDNERLGYLSHDTYDDLHYAEFRYTVRGFDRFVQFRTFLGDPEGRIGVLVSADTGTDIDFDALFAAVSDVVAGAGTDALAPSLR